MRNIIISSSNRSAPPEIVQPPENTGIDIESNGSLPCHATGRPGPKMSWRRADGRPIDIGGRFIQQLSGTLDVFSKFSSFTLKTCLKLVSSKIHFNYKLTYNVANL